MRNNFKAMSAMHRMSTQWALIATLLAALVGSSAGAASAPFAETGRGAQADADFGQWIANCRKSFARQDARVDAAGVRDAGFHRVPGFPYLRSDRLIAAFRHGVASPESVDDWAAQLLANDAYAREIEFSNLGMSKDQINSTLSELYVCAFWLTQFDLENPVAFKAIIDGTAVPNLYPQLRDAPEPASNFAASSARTTLLRYRARTKEDATQIPQDFNTVHRDHLGRIGLPMNVWRALVEKHAPEFAIETADEHDRPGAMRFAGQQAEVATDQPVAYYQLGYARVHGRSLVQLSYVVWFSARPALAQGDPEAGTLDSLIWRVTLDEQGEPLVYESLAGSGAHHRWYPAQPMRLHESRAGQMRVAEALAPHRVSVRVASASHAVADLTARVEATDTGREYELIDYDELMLLPTPQGTRSLFGPDGVVRGSERKHGAGIWPAGFPKPGAMRQWGHHIVSFTDGSYFDDPLLLERSFDLPERLGTVRELAAAPRNPRVR